MPKKRAGEAAATPPADAVVDPDLGLSGGRATKKKVSVTIDESVLEDLRSLAGRRPLSSVVNDLLERAVAQQRLSQLVDELIAEAGEPPPEAYERVLSQWFAGEDE